MKTIIKKSSPEFITIQFEQWSNLIYLHKDTVTNLARGGNCAVTDCSTTLRIFYDNKLLIWHNEDLVIKTKLNIRKFFEVCLVLFNKPENVIIKLDTSNLRYKTTEFKSYTIAQLKTKIAKFDYANNFSKLMMFAYKEGKETYLDLVDKLSNYIDQAEIYPDLLHKEFYFNGKYQGGCGYNGGMIYYNNKFNIHT